MSYLPPHKRDSKGQSTENTSFSSSSSSSSGYHHHERDISRGDANSDNWRDKHHQPRNHFGSDYRRSHFSSSDSDKKSDSNRNRRFGTQQDQRPGPTTSSQSSNFNPEQLGYRDMQHTLFDMIGDKLDVDSKPDNGRNSRTGVKSVFSAKPKIEPKSEFPPITSDESKKEIAHQEEFPSLSSYQSTPTVSWSQRIKKSDDSKKEDSEKKDSESKSLVPKSQNIEDKRKEISYIFVPRSSSIVANRRKKAYALMAEDSDKEYPSQISEDTLEDFHQSPVNYEEYSD